MLHVLRNTHKRQQTFVMNKDSRLVIVLPKSSDETYLAGRLLYCMIIRENPSLFKQGDFNPAHRLALASRSLLSYSHK